MKNKQLLYFTHINYLGKNYLFLILFKQFKIKLSVYCFKYVIVPMLIFIDKYKYILRKYFLNNVFKKSYTVQKLKTI